MTEVVRDHLDRHLLVNIGPAHPATHGTLRFEVELDGETIVRCKPEIGYLHRCFEKESERVTYTQVIPYTDRLNYCSAILNNVTYVMAVEKMMGIEIPPRGQYLRVIVSELARIMDHYICIGTNAVDIGALTNFWYFFRKREEIYTLIEKLCGARLTTSFTRIGGHIGDDVPPGWLEETMKVVKAIPSLLEDVHGLLTKNRIYVDRTVGCGVITKERAISFGYTGPCLRATGVAHDLRRANPYLVYDKFEFDIPTQPEGDTYARYLVRMEEIRQSARILEQAIATIPGGPINCDRRDVNMPPKEQVYTEMEAMIRNFKLIMHGVQPPSGEIYYAQEGANGELGFYIVSDGSGRPYRVRVRPPCFPILSSMPHLAEGQMIADMVATLGSINIIAGELDR